MTNLIKNLEWRGNGKARLHAPGIGYADVSAVYANNPQGWTVEVEQTNIDNPTTLEQVVQEFRAKELC